MHKDNPIKTSKKWQAETIPQLLGIYGSVLENTDYFTN